MWAAVGQAAVFEFSFTDGKLEPARTFPIVARPTSAPRGTSSATSPLSPDGRLIYAADLYRDAIVVINPQSGRVIETLSRPAAGPIASCSIRMASRSS